MCGVKALRHKTIADQETLVGKTWHIGRVIILCRNCGKSFEHNDYDQTKESIANFRKTFYI
jgi:hypothetical protein